MCRNPIAAMLVLAAGLFSGSSQVNAQQYSYDSIGRLTRVVYSNGAEQSFVYDPAGNLVGESVFHSDASVDAGTQDGNVAGDATYRDIAGLQESGADVGSVVSDIGSVGVDAGIVGVDSGVDAGRLDAGPGDLSQQDLISTDRRIIFDGGVVDVSARDRGLADILSSVDRNTSTADAAVGNDAGDAAGVDNTAGGTDKNDDGEKKTQPDGCSCAIGPGQAGTPLGVLSFLLLLGLVSFGRSLRQRFGTHKLLGPNSRKRIVRLLLISLLALGLSREVRAGEPTYRYQPRVAWGAIGPFSSMLHMNSQQNMAYTPYSKHGLAWVDGYGFEDIELFADTAASHANFHVFGISDNNLVMATHCGTVDASYQCFLFQVQWTDNRWFRDEDEDDINDLATVLETEQGYLRKGLFDVTGDGYYVAGTMESGATSYVDVVVGNEYEEILVYHCAQKGELIDEKMFEYCLPKAGNTIGQVAGAMVTDHEDGLVHMYKPVIFESQGVTVLENPQGSYGEALAINEEGETAGWLSANGFLDKRATVWTNKALLIGTLGGDNSEAQGINDVGEVVGWSQVATGEKVGFLFLPQDNYGFAAGLYDINSLLGSAADKYTVLNAYEIGASGEIAGQCRIEGHHASYPCLLSLVEVTEPEEPTFPYRVAAEMDWFTEVGDPVSSATGEFVTGDIVDLRVPGVIPLVFSRYYSTGLAIGGFTGSLGLGWRHNYNWRMFGLADSLYVETHRGRRIRFTKDGDDWQLASNGIVGFQLTEVDDEFHFYDPRDHLIYTFSSEHILRRIKDLNNVAQVLAYQDDKLSTVSNGYATLTLLHNQEGELVTVSDGVRTVTYGHFGGQLTYATRPDEHYSYDYENGLLAVIRGGANPIRLEYDTLGRVSRQFTGPWAIGLAFGEGTTTITNSSGQELVHTFDESGTLQQMTDALLNVTQFSYDAKGRRTVIRDGTANSEIQYLYEPSPDIGSVVTYPDMSQVTTYVEKLDVDGFSIQTVSRVEFPNGLSMLYGYDDRGNIIEITDLSGVTTSHTYNHRGQVLEVTNPLGGVGTRVYNANGSVASYTDAADNKTDYDYDPLGRLTQVTNPDGTTRGFTYDAWGNPVTAIDENGEKITFSYDDSGELETVTDKNLHAVDVEHFSATDVPHLYITDPMGNQTKVDLGNDQGLPHSIEMADGTLSLFEYDALRRVTSVVQYSSDYMESYTSTRQYDHKGHLLSRTDPLLQETSFEYDIMGRLVRSESPEGRVAQFRYDVYGNLVEMVDPSGATTTYSHDSMGRVAQVVAANGASTDMEYDAMGNVTQVLGSRGDLWGYQYDNAARLTKTTDPLDNSKTFTYNNRNWISHMAFAGDSNSVELNYDPTGNLTGQSFSDGTQIDLAYDPAGYLVSGSGLSFTRDENNNIVASNGLVIERNSTNLVESITYGVDQTVQYQYGARGEVVRVSDWLGGSIVFSYDAAGRVTELSRSNGVTTSYSYDADGYVTEIHDRDTGQSTLHRATLLRGPAGNTVQAQRQMANVTAKPAPVANSFATDLASQLVGLNYDPMGRCIADGDSIYSWNLADHLEHLSAPAMEIDYTYDAFGKILSRFEAGVTTTYTHNYGFASPVISIVNKSATGSVFYVHSPDGKLLYSIDATSQQHLFYHFDEMGSTVLLTSNSGEVTDSYAYGPFGKILDRYGNTDNMFTFAGQLGVLTEIPGRLYRMGRRLYDVPTRRFLTRDPLGDPTTGDTNLYRYALSNPLRFLDPLGDVPADYARGSLLTVKDKQDAFFRTVDGVTKYGGQIAEHGAERAQYLARGVDRANKMALTFGQSGANGMTRAYAYTQQAQKLAKVGKVLDATGQVGDYAAAILDSRTEGPGPLVKQLAKDTANKFGGKLAKGAVGAGYELVNTHQAVNKVVAEQKTNLQAALDTYDSHMSIIKMRYTLGKDMTYEQFEAAVLAENEALDYSIRGAAEAGEAGVLHESVKGGLNALGKFVGLP